MTTYGQYPGVKVTVAGGGIASIEVGSEEKVVIFGRGGIDADASVNTPVQFQSTSGLENKFGSEDINGNEPELTRGLKLARANGANTSFLYGVIVEEGGVSDAVDTTVEDPVESFTGAQSGTLSNTPIVEETELLVFDDTVDSTVQTVNFVYDTSVSQPSETDTVNLNPLTGEWSASASSDYDVYYQYPLWEDALNAADNIVNEDETGLYVTLTESEDVAGTLSGKITTLRENEFKLVNGITAAQPNSTSASGSASIDAASYTDVIDSDTQFLFAPTRFEGTNRTVLGGVAGLFGGAPISEPIYNDTVNTTGDSLEQSLTRSDARELRDKQVIPIRQAGSVRVKGNISTSTETDFTRDFWRRRITDRVILIGKEIGDRIVGRVNTPETRTQAERAIRTQLQSLADDQLIEDNTQEEQNFRVEVVQSPTNSDEILIDIGVTPVGIVKRIDVTVTINT